MKLGGGGGEAKKNGGGGGGEAKIIFPTIFFQKCSRGSETHTIFCGVFGAPHAPTRGSHGVGKRYTSSYDHDPWPAKILERSGLAVKSYHPQKNKNKNFFLTKP